MSLKARAQCIHGIQGVIEQSVISEQFANCAFASVHVLDKCARFISELADAVDSSRGFRDGILDVLARFFIVEQNAKEPLPIVDLAHNRL